MSVSSRRVVCGIVIIISFAVASPAIAQNSSHLGTPAESKTGQSGVSTYARDKIETVNLANGNFSLSIPLANVGGRGSAGYTVALSYNSKVWTSEHDVEDLSLLGGLEDVPPETPPAGPIRNLYTAVYDKLEEYEPGLAKLGGGWTIRLTPGIKALTFGINPLPSTTRCNTQSEEPPKCGYRYVITKMWLTLPDGSQVELRDTWTQGTPAIAPVSNGFYQLIDRDRGRVWRSIDGSGVIFVRDAGYPVGVSGGPHFPSGWVFLPDGTRIRMVDGAGNRIIDRNGNFVDVDLVSYTDQLGRQTVLTSSANTVTVTVKGYLGTPDRSTTIHLGVIGDNLRSHFQLLPRPFTTGDAYRDPQGNYFEHMAPLPHTDLFDHSEGIKHYGAYGEDVGARSAVTGLTLLDGRSFGFRYNQYGEVAEIVYPGGGVSQIDYSGGNSGICQINSQMAATFNRKVSERRTLTDGTNVDATWVYGHGGLNFVDGVNYPTTSVDVHQGDATGPLLASEKHYFLKLGLGAEYRACQTGNGTGNEKWENAKEFRTEMQTGTGMRVTRRNWQQRAPLVWINDGPNGYLQQAGQDQPSNDDRVTWEETTLEDGKVKRVEYAHDQFNNVTSIKEYDFGTAVSPGPLLRQTFRTYATTINGYCYNNLNPVDGSCGSGLATDVNSIIYQPRLLLSETVKDAAHNQKAYAVFEYDNYTPEPNHAPVLLNSGMIQYDGSRFATVNSATQPRGNVTRVTRWLNGGTDVVAYNQYDNAGQVIWSKEPNGNVSTVSYNDNFGDGTNPEPGSGVPGPAGPTFAIASMSTNALGHQVKMQYDYSLGAATGVKDVNGVITKTEYDNLGRPFRVTAALGLTEQSISEMSYPTVAANEARVSKQLDSTSGITRWLSSKTVFDSFDRAITSWQAEDGQHASFATFSIRTNTVYDAIGRVKLASNPYRSATETPVYTTTAYDLGGRVISVTTPDNSVVSTAYSSDLVLVTDQAGRQRMSKTNALGQLRDVWEITTADPATEALSFPGHPEVTAGYRTSYSYDLLDNLTSVTQGTQPPRTFVYDSLKRLTAVFNPESGNTAYQYDANGNLTQKTDARGVISTYTYDALNRNTTVNYSDTSITPDLTRLYDTGTNGMGRQRESYAGGNETAGATVEHTKIQSYDALGRPLDHRQRFKTNGVWSAEYKTMRGYNRAGGVAAQTYPSGRTVSYAYDNAGRTNSFSGNLGDGVARTYSSGIVYNALGARQQEQFGTQTPLFHKLHYNVRGQLNDIRLSTVNWATDQWNWNRGALLNYYSQAELICATGECRGNSGPGNNGNVVRSQHWIPANDLMSSYHSTEQRYLYDKLNRLTSVAEYPGTQSGLGPMSFTQIFDYDRWGNRTINSATTDGLPETQFIPSGNNRLGVPAGASGRMDYDAAGNLINDTHTSFGRADGLPTRLYDAENRLLTVKDGNLQVVSSYSYNADGQRVRRTVNGLQTWQVYGMDGELLAEYPSDGASSSPQTEYGYRDGTLLISTTNGETGSPSSQNVTWTNVAGVAISGNSITKNVANGWGNSGAASTESITSGDGYVEFTPTYLGGLRACGLSNGDLNQNYTDIDFAIVIGYGFGHTYRVWEGGVQKFIGPTFYDATDRFRVAVEAGVVKYYRNGALFYTSTSTPIYPLLVDTAIYTNGYPISNVVLTATSTTQAEVRWLVTDQLGSTRITVDKTGSLANARRHDYLPFGEELVAGTGGRTTGQGYVGDNIRQKFTLYERDTETGLDYAQVRYYSSTQGRFTSTDPLMASARTGSPQSFNRYSYTLNNPLRYVDPTGLREDTPDYKPEFKPCTVGVEAGCSETQTVIGAVTINISEGDPIPLTTTNLSLGENLTLYTGQVASDTVTGAGMFGYNTVFGTANLINAPIDYGLSFFTSFQFGQTELYQAETSGQQGAMYGMMIGSILAGGFGSAGGAAQTATVTNEVRTGMQVFRVFGDEASAFGNPAGGSFTFINPNSVENYRQAAGLFHGNTGRFVLEGTLNSTQGVRLRTSLPGPGGVGTLPELIIPNAAQRVTVTRVSGVNPPY